MFNWHYAVPFDLGVASKSGLSSDFRFLLHLRMHRRIHAYPEMKDQSSSCQEIFWDSEISAEVNTGLGWSDAFVNGYLGATKGLED